MRTLNEEAKKHWELELTKALVGKKIIFAKLEDEGFAVNVWTPDELGGFSVEEIEEKMVPYGWWLIAANKEY